MNPASPLVSPASSQLTSRAQSPLPVGRPSKFIQKIPPAIRYGLPGVIIGSVLPGIYHYVRSKISIPNNSNTTAPEIPKETPAPTPEPTITPRPRPRNTAMPKSTFNPKYPRSGFRYIDPIE